MNADENRLRIEGKMKIEAKGKKKETGVFFSKIFTIIEFEYLIVFKFIVLLLHIWTVSH